MNIYDSKQDVFFYWETIKRNNPRKSLHSVRDWTIMEFDIMKRQKVVEASNETTSGGIPVQGSCCSPNQHRFHQFNLWHYPVEEPSGETEPGRQIKRAKDSTA